MGNARGNSPDHLDRGHDRRDRPIPEDLAVDDGDGVPAEGRDVLDDVDGAAARVSGHRHVGPLEAGDGVNWVVNFLPHQYRTVDIFPHQNRTNPPLKNIHDHYSYLGAETLSLYTKKYFEGFPCK